MHTDHKGFVYNPCGNCLFNAYTFPTNIYSVVHLIPSWLIWTSYLDRNQVYPFCSTQVSHKPFMETRHQVVRDYYPNKYTVLHH